MEVTLLLKSRLSMWFWAEAGMWFQKEVFYYQTWIRGISTKAQKQKIKRQNKKKKRKKARNSEEWSPLGKVKILSQT